MRNNEMTEMDYESIHKLMLRQILDQAPPSLSSCIKRGMDIVAVSFHKIQLRVKEDDWVIELKHYTQGFKPGSFSVEYLVHCSNEILWSGQVFMDPDQMKSQTYENYRENKLLSSLEALEVLTQATLVPELEVERIESYLKQQVAKCPKDGMMHLFELEQLRFNDVDGMRLSEVFQFELENVFLYGFFQEIGHIQNDGQSWTIYELYAGLRKGKCYPLATRPGIKSIFHFVRTLGACWITEKTGSELIDQLIQSFEAIQWLEQQCNQIEDSAYQVTAVRRGDKIDISKLTPQQDFSRQTLEQTLTMIAEFQDLINGRFPLNEESWQDVLYLMEDLELWFILEYQGFQPFDEELIESVFEMIDRISARSKKMKNWLMTGMSSTFETDEEIVSGHYELSPQLQFQPLTVNRAVEILESIVYFLTEFHKIDYIDLSYREEMN